jgi:hypothetical protein
MIALGEGCAVPLEVRVSSTSALLIPFNVAMSCGSQAGVSEADAAVGLFTLAYMSLVIIEKELGGVAAAEKSSRRGWTAGELAETGSLLESGRPITYWKSRR